MNNILPYETIRNCQIKDFKQERGETPSFHFKPLKLLKNEKSFFDQRYTKEIKRIRKFGRNIVLKKKAPLRIAVLRCLNIF